MHMFIRVDTELHGRPLAIIFEMIGLPWTPHCDGPETTSAFTTMTVVVPRVSLTKFGDWKPKWPEGRDRGSVESQRFLMSSADVPGKLIAVPLAQMLQLLGRLAWCGIAQRVQHGTDSHSSAP